MVSIVTTKTGTREDDAALRQHIHSLGLATVDEYLDWCEQHGFGRRATKHWRLRIREREFSFRARADAMLVRAKQRSRQPLAVVRQIFQGDLEHSDVQRFPQLAAMCRLYQEVKNSSRPAATLLALVEHIFHHGNLLSVRPVVPQFGPVCGNSYLDSLLALVAHREQWIRPPAHWRPHTHNPRRQFASLVRHLFARWHVPAFMDSVWFQGTSPAALQRQTWFIRLGQGENIRHMDLPLPYTKRMAHYFTQAPMHLMIEEALRWGHLRAMGASPRLIRAVNATELATNFADHAFWEMVFRWFIAHPELTKEEISYVIRFMFVRRAEFPTFTLKGRTPHSLFRQIDEWTVREDSSQMDGLDWPSSGITSFDYVEEDAAAARRWTIRELLGAPSLGAEGRLMRHCVAGYGHQCASRISSIWTMEMQDRARTRKMLTIEVTLPDRVIYQAKGKCNAAPGKASREILRRWAETAGLKIDSDV